MKKFMQKDLSNAPQIVNRTSLRLRFLLAIRIRSGGDIWGLFGFQRGEGKRPQERLRL
jgi:hypothetical protein